MLRIAICDDEFITADYFYKKIGKILTEMQVTFEITLYTDSGKLLSDLYRGQTWQIYFLDIDMPMVDGLNLGHLIYEKDRHAYLNYVSIHQEKVYDSMKNRPFRFIPKDRFDVEIGPCLQDILKDFQTENVDYILLESGSEIHRFDTADVLYIQSLDKYVRFFTREHGTSSSIRYKLSKLEEELESKGFIRIHKSYLVNYRAIRKIVSSGVEIDGGNRLPVSQLRLQHIKDTYRRLVLS